MLTWVLNSPQFSTVTDDFNRADGAIGSNWTTVNSPLAIVSNPARGTASSSNQGNAWVGDFNPQAQFAQIVGNIANTTAYSQVGVWLNRPDSTALTGYFAGWDNSGDVYLQRATSAPGADVTVELLFEVGTGLPGAETTVLQMSESVRADTGAGYFFPSTALELSEPFYVPAGTNLSVRLTEGSASALTFDAVRLLVNIINPFGPQNFGENIGQAVNRSSVI
jgi:hypothetical protein